LDLAASAVFEGRVASVVDAYHAGHVVVLTSISEGFPYALIEAMAAGRPTVSTDVGGVREAAGSAGLVVPPRNPEAIADACLRLLIDPEERLAMGTAARERILSLFTVEQCTALYSDLYREVTGRPVSAEVVEFDQSRRDVIEARFPGRRPAFELSGSEAR
jgi:glycosyltransferase involved in cell wall biosynthesis